MSKGVIDGDPSPPSVSPLARSTVMADIGQQVSARLRQGEFEAE
jgi:hypothetical protein